MRVLVACKRGNIAPRSASGHCQCADCKQFRYRNNNSEKKKLYRKEWLAKNPDKVKAYNQKWQEANKEKRKAVVDSWRKRNPDKVKDINYRAGSKWAKNNKDKKNAATSRRRAKLAETSVYGDSELIKLHYAWAVWYSDTTGVPHEVDHVIPLSKGGHHTETNLQILPREWNRSKGARL